eukprot:CAMPEP_0185595942 /NCGR_PEP_ID=MMETSP0434-20130131/80069_1 /TAXON_ID=626734 ORGANISM="Favella taraikaensis, Strain Fe Narragansett Bay" /NCGR_SAMPLE_ID=MMETSP0434 /ASSEMBLY_ACC=CAM_ASM_000379 /LENGTH=197 /DNA_ID=CAMNT_0028224271 /DNA_START=316 /DNA_END=909 /DNA_ORIENTATION=+
MQAIVSDGLVNVFSDTDPAEPVLGTLYQNRDFSSQLGHTSAVLKKAPSSPQIIESRENRYEWVAHLLPDHTELEEDFLGIVVRNSVISSAEFLSLVEKIKAAGPAYAGLARDAEGYDGDAEQLRVQFALQQPQQHFVDAQASMAKPRGVRSLSRTSKTVKFMKTSESLGSKLGAAAETNNEGMKRQSQKAKSPSISP